MAGRPMDAFYPFLSGWDNLRAVARRCGLGDHRVDVVLGQAGLAERAGDAVAGCSYGMRQRLGVAAAAAFWAVSPCPVCGRRRAPFEVLDQAGEHGKPGAFEVFGAIGERPGLVDVEADDRPIARAV
jgi:hypothetical protein